MLKTSKWTTVPGSPVRERASRQPFRSSPTVVRAQARECGSRGAGSPGVLTAERGRVERNSRADLAPPARR
jgi:hypothetical protein